MDRERRDATMPENVEVDFGGLTTAADILNELSGNFESISSRAAEIMGHNIDALSESFSAYTEGVGGRTGAKTALSGTEQASGETIRRSV
ncbi:hypothetical protein [Nocardia sp. NBC_01329]|uniref:hypothetical protein n=1 Tax=Nocardia sp. NBC_01329 TaxID=2903594 RepID=UPI002E0E6DCC|nr:hypothetical protein OG405_14850 [Nocardia sp. NBC_01329]